MTTTASPLPTFVVSVNPEFDSLKKIADEFLSHKDWSLARVISLATSLAVQVNSFAKLSGSEKKQLVIDVVKVRLNELLTASINDNQAEKQLALRGLVFFADNGLSSVLDMVVAAARGKFDLKKKVEASGISRYFSCFACKKSPQASLEIRVPLSVPSDPVVLQENPAKSSALTALALEKSEST